MTSAITAFCVEHLHRLPSEIDTGQSELYRAMIAVAVERERAGGY